MPVRPLSIALACAAVMALAAPSALAQTNPARTRLNRNNSHSQGPTSWSEAPSRKTRLMIRLK